MQENGCGGGFDEGATYEDLKRPKEQPSQDEDIESYYDEDIVNCGGVGGNDPNNSKNEPLMDQMPIKQLSMKSKKRLSGKVPKTSEKRAGDYDASSVYEQPRDRGQSQMSFEHFSKF